MLFIQQIAIKIGFEKIWFARVFAFSIQRELLENEVRIVPIEIRNTILITLQPDHHPHPFGGFLIIRSLVEGISKVSRKSALAPMG